MRQYLVAALALIVPSVLSQVAWGQNTTATSSAVFVMLSDESGEVAEPENSIQLTGCDIVASAPYGGLGSCCDSIGPGCDSCGIEIPCQPCNVLGRHGCGVYGGLLFLRARDADVSYGAIVDGPITAPTNSPVIVNPLGSVDPDYEPGFYAGVRIATNDKTSIDLRYTMFESSTADSISTDAPLVVRSLVIHPSTTNVSTDFLDASANLDIDFDTIDVDMTRLVSCGPLHAINVLLGARYATLEQTFQSQFETLGRTNVNTDIDFDGGGIRVGLLGDFFGCGRNLTVYSRGVASFVGGRFRGEYFQGSSVDPVIADTHWEAGRIVPILDFELGARYCHKGFQFSAGYLVSSWFNTPDTAEWIEAVQKSDFSNVDGTLTFDGLTARVEYTW